MILRLFPRYRPLYIRAIKNPQARAATPTSTHKFALTNSGKNAPIITPVKPTVEPGTPSQRPLKIPKKWPNTMPKPKPKAKVDFQLNENKNKNIKSFPSVNYIKETNFMNKMILSEAPMDVDPSPYGDPHPSIRRGIESGENTPFSNIDLFNKRNQDKSTIEKLGGEEYKKVVDDFSNVEPFRNQMEGMSALEQMKTIEAPHKEALEDLAVSIVKRKFGLSDELAEKIKPQLTDEDMSMEDDDDDIEEEVMEELTPEQQAVVKKHLDKRIVHNALMMGSGYRSHSLFNEAKTTLDNMDERLFPLYKKVMGNFDLIMWKMPVDAGIEGRQVAGKAELEIDEEGEVSASAKAIVFPILLHEVAKAAVELLFAQHLVDIWEKHGEQVYNAVLKQSESYTEEHWMKLIGPRLWKYLHDSIDFVVQEEGEDYTIVSYILNRLGIMEPEEFMEFMENVLHNGPEAIAKIKLMISEINDDIDEFENQNNETPTPEELTAGEEDHSNEIEKLINQSKEELLKGKEGENPGYSAKELKDMNVDELNIELNKALESEDYEKAGKIRDQINARIKK